MEQTLDELKVNNQDLIFEQKEFSIASMSINWRMLILMILVT